MQKQCQISTTLFLIRETHNILKIILSKNIYFGSSPDVQHWQLKAIGSTHKDFQKLNCKFKRPLNFIFLKQSAHIFCSFFCWVIDLQMFFTYQKLVTHDISYKYIGDIFTDVPKSGLNFGLSSTRPQILTNGHCHIYKINTVHSAFGEKQGLGA